MDIDETNLTLSVANIQNTFETEQAIQEKDSYLYSKLHAELTTYSGRINTDVLLLLISWRRLIQKWLTWMRSGVRRKAPVCNANYEQDRERSGRPPEDDVGKQSNYN